jgi:SAM-dependent methyltransferase
MVAVAKRVAPTVDFRVGSAESLAWPDGSFDAVLSQFGLMFFADRAAAAREMMRVLVPGGRLVVAVWASLSETPAFAAEVETLERVAGSRAADALRAPFVMGERDELVRLLEGAGASGIDVDTRRAPAEFPTARSLVEADVRGWLPLMGAALPDARIDDVLRETAAALRPYVRDDGTLRFEAAAHIATATKPPLRNA